MLVTRRAEILIKADPEQIWDFINDPAQWMASNPEEHYGSSDSACRNRASSSWTRGRTA